VPALQRAAGAGDDYGAMRFALDKRYRKLADGEGKRPT
jgi:excinuclease UvrABC nuclease subunit